MKEKNVHLIILNKKYQQMLESCTLQHHNNRNDINE